MRIQCVALALALCAAAGAVAETGHWLDVPFVKQPSEGCGAASIAMVIQYWERYESHPSTELSDVKYIQRALHSKQAHGIYASDIQRYLNQRGFATFVFHGDHGLLAHHIGRGRPLIVALKPASDSPLHYVVISGIEPEEHVLLMNDPAQRKLLKVDFRNFDNEWKNTGNWTLLAIPSSDTP
jgi:predicted double-glycine peptidase